MYVSVYWCFSNVLISYGFVDSGKMYIKWGKRHHVLSMIMYSMWLKTSVVKNYVTQIEGKI